MISIAVSIEITSSDMTSIAKACLRQGSFAPGNPGMSTTGGRSASAAQQSHLLCNRCQCPSSLSSNECDKVRHGSKPAAPQPASTMFLTVLTQPRSAGQKTTGRRRSASPGGDRDTFGGRFTSKSSGYLAEDRREARERPGGEPALSGPLVGAGERHRAQRRRYDEPPKLGHRNGHGVR